MKLFALNALQISFIITASLVGLVFIYLVIYFTYIKKHRKNNFRQYFYKKIYNIAFDNDYYLINNFIFRIDDYELANVDHIIFADKYIYIISDFYYEGDLIGLDTDKSLVLTSNTGKRYYTDNPMLLSEKIINRLSLITGIDKEMMIGVDLINDQCHIAVESKSHDIFLIQRKQLKQLIKAIESRNVGKINAKELDAAVQAFDKLNRRKKHEKNKSN